MEKNRKKNKVKVNNRGMRQRKKKDKGNNLRVILHLDLYKKNLVMLNSKKKDEIKEEEKYCRSKQQNTYPQKEKGVIVIRNVNKENGLKMKEGGTSVNRRKGKREHERGEGRE